MYVNFNFADVPLRNYSLTRLLLTIYLTNALVIILQPQI